MSILVLLNRDELQSVGRSTAETRAKLTSRVLALTFQRHAGDAAQIQVIETGVRTWLI